MANSQQRNEFVLSRFSGLSSDVDPFKAPIGNASAIRNMELSNTYGKLTGSADFPGTVLTYSATLLHEYEVDQYGDGSLLTNNDGKLSTGSTSVVIRYTTDTPPVPVYQALGANAHAVNMQGKVFLTDGTAYVYYDGDAEAGLPPGGLWGTLEAPGTPGATTVNTGGHGYTTGGLHSYFVVWSDSSDPTANGAHVSAPSATGTFTASDEELTQHFTAGAPAYAGGLIPAWAKYMCVFMTQADVQGFHQGTFYFVNSTVIAFESTDATVDIDIADSEVGLPWKPFSVPPVCKLIATYMDRICVANATAYPNRIYFSEASDPFRFGNDNWVDVSTDSDDSITSIVAIPAGLLIIMTRSVHVLTGYSPATFRITRVSEETGSSEPRGTVLFGGAAYWINPHGLWMTSGGKPVNLAEGKIVQYLQAATWNGTCIGGYCPEYNQLWFTMSTGEVMVYDMATREFIFRKFEHRVQGLGILTVAGIPRTVLTQDELSDPTAPEQYWTSHWMDFGTSRKKRLAQILIEYDKHTSGDMEVYIDASDGPSDAGWTTTLVVQHDLESYIIPVSMQGRYFRIKISASAEETPMGISRVVFYHFPTGVN